MLISRMLLRLLDWEGPVGKMTEWDEGSMLDDGVLVVWYCVFIGWSVGFFLVSSFAHSLRSIPPPLLYHH